MLKQTILQNEFEIFTKNKIIKSLSEDLHRGPPAQSLNVYDLKSSESLAALH